MSHDAIFTELSPKFEELYSDRGRPSIPPEHLLSALILQAVYWIRSERQLMEQLDYNLLFRWFCNLNMDDPVWDVTVFTKNRARLLAGDVAKAFFERVLGQAREADLLCSEHFTVDGTMIEACAVKEHVQRFRCSFEATAQLIRWVASGRINHRETVVERIARSASPTRRNHILDIGRRSPDPAFSRTSLIARQSD